MLAEVDSAADCDVYLAVTRITAQIMSSGNAI